MAVEFYDGIEDASVDWGDYSDLFPATSELMFAHQLMLEMDLRLSDMLKVSKSQRGELAERLKHIFSICTENQAKLCFANDLKNLVTVDTDGIIAGRELIELIDPIFYQMLGISKNKRIEFLEKKVAEFVVPRMGREIDTSLVFEVNLVRAEIERILEATRGSIAPSITLEQLSSGVTNQGTYQIRPENLIPIFDGISGSYILITRDGIPQFVVKPVDEDISGLNNPKGYGLLNYGNLFQMELYRSVFREMAVSLIAEEIEVTSIAPKTILAILESERFYDIGDENPFFGAPVKEKLCSCMEFISGAKSLAETAQDLQQMGLSDDEIASRFDQTDYENVNILLWVTGEQDGHGGNILTYAKGFDARGNEIIGFKKIDNGLSLPENCNAPSRNSLVYLPNGQKALSQCAIDKIMQIDVEKLTQILEKNSLNGSVQSLKFRLEKLKSLVTLDPTLSIKEINKSLSKKITEL